MLQFTRMFLLDENAFEIKETPLKGKGIFATALIAPGTIIGDYLGKVMRPGDIDEKKDGLYEMYFSNKASIFPDLSIPGIHLLNHSCMPNCWLYTFQGHTLYFATRQIFPGEELTTSYLLGLKEDCDADCKHACLCGTPICSGSMHLENPKYDAWWKFEERSSKKTKRVRVKIGEQLAALETYPISVPDAPVYDLFGNYRKAPEVYAYTALPTITELRRRVRESGRILYFSRLNKTILGVSENKIIEK